MTPRNTTDSRNALRRAPGVAGASWVGSFALVGGHADSGFGLVVVDQGNPRHRGGMANSVFAAPI